MFELTTANVERVFLASLFEHVDPGEVPANAVIVSGIVLNAGFDPVRLEAQRANVDELVGQIDDRFKEGYSFLQLPFSKDGAQWGEHRNAEQLLLLGIALKRLVYCAPRAVWSLLPGGLPYIQVVDVPREST